jgi:hypothetical protein
LIASQFALVVTVDGNGIMQFNHPIVVQVQQLFEHPAMRGTCLP